MSNLENLIKQKKAKVAIIGLGYVGLPEAIEIAKAGYRVIGMDIKKARVDSINNGKSYIFDASSKELKKLVRNGKLKAYNDHKFLKNADIVLICVPTPLDKHKSPDVSYIKSTTKEIAKYLHKGQLIILESSTYPGTTREVVLPELVKSVGKRMKIGRDFFLAYAPERIDPGNKNYGLRDVARVVGGVNNRSANLAVMFYKSFIKAEIRKLTSLEAAEFTKILENTFRLVNISMINELALLCGRMGIDVWEVIEAAKTKPYGFMPFYPSPKCSGHCIPLVPFFLSYKAREYNFWIKFIELAGEINEQMPHYVMTKVVWVLNLNRKQVRGSKVLVWGVSYKKDIGDTRESASFDIVADLTRKGAKVDYFDPFVPKLRIEHRILKKPVVLSSIKYSLGKIKDYDLILILTDHSDFDYDKIAKEAELVVDTRNAVKSRRHKNVFRL